ncbi:MULTISPECIES: HAD family hydrolase [Bifidobacterium]|uniref:HAD family hydrolase n=1 Tax=Bifidobacterium TaxID=1678 RepID=UPI001BDD97D3|nr:MULTISPECIES: HAD family phosphatase [Bifidobacterium]MBT1161501.1 HAD family phosphatase [Bifidobacterium sp. SO1]MBW3078877.1 HAD family phosphatase [Bifidobacterium simiiventris]
MIDDSFTPKAVLWDLDGTLVDSDPLWVAAERHCAERCGVPWNEELSLKMTAAPLPVCAAVLQDAGVSLDETTIIGELVADVTAMYGSDVPWTPGAWDMLLDLRSCGIPSVLVTGSPRSLAEHVVDAAPHGSFVGIVSGDDDIAHKPDPAPYLRGARLAGVPPRECLVFEDSVSGIASALAAGAHAIGVNACARVPLPDDADYPVLDSLRDWHR